MELKWTEKQLKTENTKGFLEKLMEYLHYRNKAREQEQQLAQQRRRGHAGLAASMHLIL